MKYLITASLRAGGALSLLILSFAMSHLLTPKEAGHFFHTYAMIMLLAPLALIGLSHLGIRLVAIAHSAAHYSDIRGFVIISVSVVTVVSFAITPLGLAANDIWGSANIEVSGTPSTLTEYLLPGLVIIGLMLSFILQGLSRPNASIICQSILPPFLCILILLAFLPLGTVIGNGYQQALLAYSAGALIAICAAIIAIIKTVGLGKSTIPVELRPSRSLQYFWMVSLGTAVINWCPLFFLGLFSPHETVGQFNIAQRLATGLALLQVTVAMVVSPKLAVLYERKALAKLQSLVRKIILALCALSFPIAILLYLFQWQIFSLFGDEPAAISGQFLTIMLITQAFNVLTGPSNQLLLMAKREKEMAIVSTISAILSLTITVVLLQFMGPLGAAWGLFVGIVTQNVSAAVIVNRSLGIDTYGLQLLKR